MRRTLVAMSMAAGLAALAGCGGGAHVVTHGPPDRAGRITFTAPTTTTIADPQTGLVVRCVHRGVVAGAHVPAAGKGVGDSESVTGSADGNSGAATLNLTRKADGSLAVLCAP